MLLNLIISRREVATVRQSMATQSPPHQLCTFCGHSTATSHRTILSVRRNIDGNEIFLLYCAHHHSLHFHSSAAASCWSRQWPSFSSVRAVSVVGQTDTGPDDTRMRLPYLYCLWAWVCPCDMSKIFSFYCSLCFCLRSALPPMASGCLPRQKSA